MTKAMTTQERASRQRVVMALRQWMDAENISRTDVAREFGITEGHLRTLLNANRTASEEQCQKAIVIMDAKFAPHPNDSRRPKGVKPLKRRKKDPAPRPAVEPRVTEKPNNLRPLTKFEADFVADVAKAWINAHMDASQDEFVGIVRALSIGIRC